VRRTRDDDRALRVAFVDDSGKAVPTELVTFTRTAAYPKD
jgi:hypothetical protein